MDTPALLQELNTLVGPKNVLASPEDLAVYAYDGTAMLNQAPAAVVMAQSTDHVASVLKFAHASRTPVVTRGSGTGLSGGSVPVPNGIVLCTVRMNRILEVDPANLTLTAEPGVLTQKVSEAADAAGLFYPPDPGSMKISTIGGNVAENSGGLRGLKYGITRNYVMGLQVVLADGTVFNTGNKCVKDVAGYSLKDIFIGSEGTLGVLTAVLLRLLPRPKAKRTLLAVYDTMTAAAETVSAIVAAHIIPCTLEFLDRVTINCVEDYAKIGLPRDAEAILFMETDGHPAVVAEEAARMGEIAAARGAREVRLADTVEEANRLAAARRTAFSALARIAPTVILEDATVPRNRLADMIAFIQATAQKHSLKIGTFGHMGDGNLHPTFLTNEKDTAEMAKVEEAMKEIFDKAIELGGTITGEHGVGLAKKSFLPGQLGDENMGVHRKLKAALDPHNILNPGKIF